MLLHTLEQTFQAGAVRSLGAYFFYILPFRLSFFACCCHVEILTYLFLAYCIQQEGKKLEMRRPVDIDAICLFWLTDSNARRLGASSPSRLARYTATMTVSNWHCLLVCYTNYRRTWTQQICMASAFYRRGGREALVIVRHSILPPIRLLLLLLLKLLHAVSAVVEFHDGQNHSTAQHGHSKRYASAGAPRDAGFELLFSCCIWDWADRMDM